MRCLLLVLVSYVLISAGIPNDIYDITWHTREGDKATHFVIYKDHEGMVKAIWQQEGISVYVEESIIYEVSLSKNTLQFHNGCKMLGQDNKPAENITLNYSTKIAGFVSDKNTNPYKVIADRPIIYSKYGWLIDLEELKNNSYEVYDFQ